MGAASVPVSPGDHAGNPAGQAESGAAARRCSEVEEEAGSVERVVEG